MKAFIEAGAFEPNLIEWLIQGYHGIFVEPHPANIISLVNQLEIIKAEHEISYDIYVGVLFGNTIRVNLVYRSPQFVGTVCNRAGS